MEPNPKYLYRRMFCAEDEDGRYVYQFILEKAGAHQDNQTRHQEPIKMPVILH